MKTDIHFLRRVPQLAWTVCLGACLLMVLLSSAAVADEPARSDESLAMRMARVEVALAETNLKRVEAINRRVVGTVPAHVVAAYRGQLSLAKAKLQTAQAGQTSSFEAYLRQAQANAEEAHNEWQRAKAAETRTPGAVGESELSRLRLEAELASLSVEAGLAVDTAAARRQWQFDYLLQEIRRLNEAARRQPPPSGAVRTWRWGY